MAEQPILITRVGVDGADQNGLCAAIAEQQGGVEIVSSLERRYGGINNVFDEDDAANARAEAFLQASDCLLAGTSAVLNTNLYREADQHNARQLAERRGAMVLFLDIRTSMDLTVRRLQQRSLEFPEAVAFNAPRYVHETQTEIVDRLRKQALARLAITHRPDHPDDDHSVLEFEAVDLKQSLELIGWHIDRRLRQPSTKP